MKRLKTYKLFENITDDLLLDIDDILLEIEDSGLFISRYKSSEGTDKIKIQITKDPRGRKISLSGKFEITQEIEDTLERLSTYVSKLGWSFCTFEIHLGGDEWYQLGKGDIQRYVGTEVWYIDVNITDYRGPDWYKMRYGKMKHLNKISEELKSSVYKSAADKLAKLGHKRRVSDLESWAKIKLEKEKEELQKQFQKEIEPLGTFTINIRNGEYIGDFYINLVFDKDMFNEHYTNWIYGEQKDLYTFLSFGVLPVDEDFDYTDIADSYGKNRNGSYWLGQISIHLGEYPDDVDQVEMQRIFDKDSLSTKLPHPKNPKGIVHLEDWEYAFHFNDRRSAVKFRKSIIDIFKGNVDYKETTENPGGLKEQFVDYFCSDNPILTIGEFEEFITSLGKMNINRFYKD